MTWKIKSFAEIGGNKDQEFLKIIALPSITRVQLELAVNGPKEFLEQYGWHCRDAYAVSCDLNMYRKYLRTSLGEFSVAKHTYVQTNSGWFSDRTECYLAAGRPAVVQDTGFSVHLPVGEGLLAFHTIDEARVMLESVVTDYPRHARAAREIAVEYFAAERVLSALLERITG